MANPLQIGRSRLGRARRSGEHALRRVDARRRPLPDFVIVGAQKAGTTSLHDYLCQHPSVSSPATKEVHFFDLAYGRGVNWYRAHFRPPRPGGITGESTPYYLFHPLAPLRLQETLPEAKLIVLLRDPVDRAFSHHNHERALGYEQLDFEPALAAEAERLVGEEERLIAEPGYRSHAHQHFSYLARGRYADQLERWFERCGEERFLVLSAEELFADPAPVVAAAQDFLGLPRRDPGDLSAKNARSYAPIPESLRERLREHFAPANQRLHALLGRDFGWD